MKILLVEDDENKGRQLASFIAHKFPSAELKLVRSLQSAVRFMRSNLVDLVLLDMTLPNYDAGPDEPGGGTTHSFGGREFLKQMDRFEISTPIIVVTQFETFGKEPNAIRLPELDEQLRREHAPAYKGAIYYHASISGWQDQLELMIEEIGDCNQSRKANHD